MHIHGWQADGITYIKYGCAHLKKVYFVYFMFQLLKGFRQKFYSNCSFSAKIIAQSNKPSET